ncbi:hypothetical protein [Brevibacillus laterosporus]|uniref:hypothetical protein n=1 Tax=Brevibacillus laterosporus TaxID=1465 RepID=UPI0018F89EE7|nr:hypothetical protein [Brevibacillus laterosporus]
MKRNQQMNILDFDQSDMDRLAKILSNYMKKAEDEGFSKEEALELTMNLQAAMLMIANN